MKKILFLSIIMVTILSGCDASAMKTMSCTSDNTYAGINTRVIYDVDYQDSEVKKLRITYKYHNYIVNDTDGDGTEDMDGVGTGTDGTTNDTQQDKDGIIDGIIGSAIDGTISGVYNTILDISGLKDRHAVVRDTYGNIPGFSIQNTSDLTDNDYTVSYIIDYDTISDDDLTTLNLSRDIDTLKSNYVSQGLICE